MRCPNKGIIVGLLLCLWTTVYAFASESRQIKFSETTIKEGIVLKLQGTGYRRFLFMKAFDAGFYFADDLDKETLLSNVPKHLEVEYHLGIPAKSLSDFTVSYMKLNVSKNEFANLKNKIQQMRQYFVDLKPNDRFSLTYLPNVGTQFAHNGKLTGTIEGEDFGRALFAVWIGNKPFDPVLKNKIIGFEKSRREK